MVESIESIYLNYHDMDPDRIDHDHQGWVHYGVVLVLGLVLDRLDCYCCSSSLPICIDR